MKELLTPRVTPIRRFIELFIILALLLVLLGKIFFSRGSTIWFLFSYGVAVTLIVWMVFFVAFIFYRDPYDVLMEKKLKEGTLDSDDGNQVKPMISCMVAVRNEEDHIDRCIDSMLRQSYTNKEIIVVNDASTDGTLKILQEYEARGEIILIDIEKNVGKKKALAQAMAIASGEIFAHTDSDSVWATDAIEKIAFIFMNDPDVGAVSGHGRALNGDVNLLTKMQDSWMEGQFSVRKACESVFNAVTCVSGPLAVFRKSAMFNLIPAWENDRFLGQEFRFATDRTMTALVLGNNVLGPKLKIKYKDSPFVSLIDYPSREWKVIYCKAARCWTIVPTTFVAFMRQQIRWKKSFIRNIFFTGYFYWRKPLPTALVYYLHVLFVLMGPFISFRHLIYLPSRGDWFSAVVYLSGILFIGFMFAFACKLEDKFSHRWIYRPFMSVMSTLVISWLIFYSAATIRKMVWHRA